MKEDQHCSSGIGRIRHVPIKECEEVRDDYRQETKRKATKGEPGRDTPACVREVSETAILDAYTGGGAKKATAGSTHRFVRCHHVTLWLASFRNSPPSCPRRLGKHRPVVGLLQDRKTASLSLEHGLNKNARCEPHVDGTSPHTAISTRGPRWRNGSTRVLGTFSCRAGIQRCVHVTRV